MAPVPTVAFVVDSDRFGGAEVYVARLLRALAPSVRPILVARAPVPPPLLAAARHAHAEVVQWSPGAGGLVRLLAALRSADVVHLNLTWPGGNAQAVVLSWLVRTPVVATLHLFVAPRSELRAKVLHLAHRRIARLIAVSQDIAAAAVDRLGARPARVRVVANGVEIAARRERPPRPESGPLRIGSLGRLTPQKGFDLLVSAVRRLVEEHHRLEVVVAGEGPERAALQALSAGLPVRFVGEVAEAGAFLDDLDIFCLPSRNEGLPYALLEAMAAGLPCVGTAVGDADACLGGVGVVVPPEDPEALAAALARLLRSPDLRHQLGRAARERVATRYSLNASVDGTLAVYREVLPGWADRTISRRVAD